MIKKNRITHFIVSSRKRKQSWGLPSNKAWEWEEYDLGKQHQTTGGQPLLGSVGLLPWNWVSTCWWVNVLWLQQGWRSGGTGPRESYTELLHAPRLELYSCENNLPMSKTERGNQLPDMKSPRTNTSRTNKSLRSTSNCWWAMSLWSNRKNE